MAFSICRPVCTSDFRWGDLKKTEMFRDGFRFRVTINISRMECYTGLGLGLELKNVIMSLKNDWPKWNSRFDISRPAQ